MCCCVYLFVSRTFLNVLNFHTYLFIFFICVFMIIFLYYFKFFFNYHTLPFLSMFKYSLFIYLFYLLFQLALDFRVFYSFLFNQTFFTFHENRCVAHLRRSEASFSFTLFVYKTLLPFTQAVPILRKKSYS